MLESSFGLDLIQPRDATPRASSKKLFFLRFSFAHIVCVVGYNTYTDDNTNNGFRRN